MGLPATFQGPGIPALMKILNLLLWPFLLPVLLLVYLLWPKARPHFSERLGLGRLRLTEKGYLLFHTASLGEARGSIRLIEALSRRVPLLLTTMTLTGREALSKAHPDLPVTLSPLDLPGIWSPFLKSRRVRGILLFETEIWPAMLSSARELGIPVGLVNGRLSSRSFLRYRKLAFLVRPFTERIAPVAVQSERDRERFRLLGVPSEALHVTGNLKWDVDPSALLPERAPGARQWLGIGNSASEGSPILRVLGSSVHPEEALALFRACRRVSETGRPVSLVLAPRHLETLPGLLSRLSPSASISLRVPGPGKGEGRVAPKPLDPDRTLYILNTYGELGAVISLVDVVFVGGTLDPVGGHSPVEAAFHGKPLLWGPHRDHIADLAEGLSEAGASIEVSGEADLVTALGTLWDDGERRARMGAAARGVFEACGGPLERTLSVLAPFLDSIFPESR